MSSEELKPCPFCGGDVSFHKDEECPGCHLIQCGQCRAFFDFATGADPGNDCASVDALRAAIAPMWNRRAQLAALEAECERLRQQRDKLAQALENVDREHALIRQMKNCEIQRGRGSFGIAVMSDPPALEWQALDKELQQLIDARHAAMGVKLAAIKGQEGE